MFATATKGCFFRSLTQESSGLFRLNATIAHIHVIGLIPRLAADERQYLFLLSLFHGFSSRMPI